MIGEEPEPSPVSLTFHLIFSDSLHLTGGLDPENPVDLKIEFDQKLTPKVETIDITDSRLKAAWGDQLYRILLIKSNPEKKGDYKISISQSQP